MEDSRDKQALDEGWDADESARGLAAQTAPAEASSPDAADANEEDLDSYPADAPQAHEPQASQEEEQPEGEGAPNAGPGREGDRRGPRRRRRRPRDKDNYEGDERAQHALDFVRTVVQQMGMDCRARLKRGRPEADGASPEIVIELSGRDSARIIGKKGQVLTALQFLTHRVVNRAGLERRHVLVDAEGYRMRRESSLASMARKLGKQAVDQGKIITFEPMNPRDRRVVHLALAKFEGVITKSDGEGDERRVQIIPVRR